MMFDCAIEKAKRIGWKHCEEQCESCRYWWPADPVAYKWHENQLRFEIPRADAGTRTPDTFITSEGSDFTA